jgi:hypothetical protein
MVPCQCRLPAHDARLVVLTGGPGAGKTVGTTLESELARYAAVIHLRTPSTEGGYNHQNVLRTESAAEAAAIDERIARAWSPHPRRFFVESSADFLEKAARAIALIRAELTPCCREHVVAPEVTHVH